MENFKKGGFKKMGSNFGGRPKFGSGKKFGGNFSGGRDGGGRPGGYTELFAAVCSTCKKDCKVPFRPTGDKPVYCRDCFDRQEQVPGRNSQRRDRSVSFGRDFQRDARPPQNNPRPYQPPQARFQSEDGMASLKRQLIVLESKVNRILEVVSQKSENPGPITPAAEEVTKSAKATKKSKQ